MAQNILINQGFSKSHLRKNFPISVFCRLCITAIFLVSCRNQEPVMVNVRAKDMNTTGERYYEDWTKMEARTVATLKKYRHKEIPLGRYNDRTDMKSEKTGFHYTRKIDGKWWTISQDGHPLIAIGINSLNLRASDRVKFTYSVKYGTPEKWADDAIPLLQRYGYNGAGSWADVEQVRAYNERHGKHFSYCP